MFGSSLNRFSPTACNWTSSYSSIILQGLNSTASWCCSSVITYCTIVAKSHKALGSDHVTISNISYTIIIPFSRFLDFTHLNAIFFASFTIQIGHNPKHSTDSWFHQTQPLTLNANFIITKRVLKSSNTAVSDLWPVCSAEHSLSEVFYSIDSARPLILRHKKSLVEVICLQSWSSLLVIWKRALHMTLNSADPYSENSSFNDIVTYLVVIHSNWSVLC